MARMMRLREAAKKTGLSYYYLRNACLNNEIPYLKSGNRFLINFEWLENYLMNMDEMRDTETKAMQ